MRPIKNLRQNNSNFHTRLQDDRRVALPTSSNTVDGGLSSEKKRLNSILTCYSCPSLYPSFKIHLIQLYVVHAVL